MSARSSLFHAAVRQSLVAVHVIAAGGQSVDAIAFDSVPMTVFSAPEVAQVGLTVRQAEDRLGAVSSTR